MLADPHIKFLADVVSAFFEKRAGAAE